CRAVPTSGAGWPRPTGAKPAVLPARRGTPRRRRSRRESDPSGLEQPDVPGDLLRRDREEVGGALVAAHDAVEDEAVADVGLRPPDADLIGAPDWAEGLRPAEQPVARSAQAAI